MPAPVMTTTNAAANRLASQALAAAAVVTFNLDYSGKVGGLLQVQCTFGTVAATSGLQVDAYRRVNAVPTQDTEAVMSFVIPSTAATTKDKSFALTTGRWAIKLTNLDATNGLTGVQASDDTIDSYT